MSLCMCIKKENKINKGLGRPAIKLEEYEEDKIALFTGVIVEDVMKSFMTHNIKLIKERPTHSTLLLIIKGLKQYVKVISSTQIK